MATGEAAAANIRYVEGCYEPLIIFTLI